MAKQEFNAQRRGADRFSAHAAGYGAAASTLKSAADDGLPATVTTTAVIPSPSSGTVKRIRRGSHKSVAAATPPTVTNPCSPSSTNPSPITSTVAPGGAWFGTSAVIRGSGRSVQPLAPQSSATAIAIRSGLIAREDSGISRARPLLAPRPVATAQAARLAAVRESRYDVGRMLTWWTRRRLQTALLAGIVAWGALDAAVVLGTGVELLLHRSPSCPTELYLLEGMQASARGADLYPEISGLPFVLRIYNPLAYAFVGGLSRLLAVDLRDFDRGLVFSRIPSLICSLLICALLAWYVHRQSGSTAIAALTIVLLLALHSSTLTELARNRPEPPALLATLLGWIAAQRRPRGWPAWSAACFAVAFLFKQSYIAAPLAVAIQLAVAREPAQLKRFLGALAVLGGAGLTWCLVGFGDDYLTHAVFALASNPLYVGERVPFFAGVLLRYHWGPFVALAFAGAVVWLLRRGLARGLLIYIGVCLPWTLLSSSKAGSDLNYYCELSLLLVLALSTALADLRSRDARLLWAPLACLLLYFAVGAALRGPGWNRVCVERTKPELPCRDAERPRESVLAAAERRYRHTPLPTLYFDEELAVRMHQPVLLDYYLLNQLVGAGFLSEQIDPQRLVALIRARRYRRLVFPRPGNHWTARLISEAAASGYRTARLAASLIEMTLPAR